MSDVEFVGKMNPQPLRSFAQIEKERIEEIKKAKLKVAGKLPPDPEPEYSREPFIE